MGSSSFIIAAGLNIVIEEENNYQGGIAPPNTPDPNLTSLSSFVEFEPSHAHVSIDTPPISPIASSVPATFPQNQEDEEISQGVEFEPIETADVIPFNSVSLSSSSHFSTQLLSLFSLDQHEEKSAPGSIPQFQESEEESFSSGPTMG